MTSRSYFGKMNSILGSVVPLAMFHYCPLLSFFFFYIAVRCHLSCVFFLIVLFCLSFSIIISSKVWPGVEQLDLYSKMEVPKIQKSQVICIVMISLYNI